MFFFIKWFFEILSKMDVFSISPICKQKLKFNLYSCMSPKMFCYTEACLSPMFIQLVMGMWKFIEHL